MNLKNKKIIITGADGFIGSHLTEKLVKKGLQVRDFNFIDDTTEAFIKTVESDRSVGETMNAGSNFEVSIGRTAELIAELMNTDMEIVSESARIRPEKSSDIKGLSLLPRCLTHDQAPCGSFRQPLKGKGLFLSRIT